jgi:hypothetical protein
MAFGTLATAQNALKLEWVLSGPAIGGAVPSGKAVLDQPSLPGRFRCEVKEVNLPNGSVLSVSVNGYIAGTITLDQRQGRMEALIPFEVRTGPFEILFGGTAIMTGRWKL